MQASGSGGGGQRSALGALGCSGVLWGALMAWSIHHVTAERGNQGTVAGVAKDAPVSNYLEVWPHNIGILSLAYFSGLEADDSSSDWGTFGSLSTSSLK